MTSNINIAGHASRKDRARYNEPQGIEILRGNSRDAHAETADNRSGSIDGNVAAKPSEPAHGRLRLARAGCTSCSWAPPPAPSPGTANRCRGSVSGVDARAMRHLVRERDLPSALRDAYQSPRPPVPRTGPHHRRHACTRLRDAARCSVDRAMRAGLDLDRCRIGIDRSGVRRAVPQRRSSSHFVRSAARLPHRGGPLPRRARLAACWSMRDLCAAARDFRLDPVREAENMVVENRAIVQPFEIHLGKFSWKIGICACLIGMADGVVRAVFITANAATVDTFYVSPCCGRACLPSPSSTAACCSPARRACAPCTAR